MSPLQHLAAATGSAELIGVCRWFSSDHLNAELKDMVRLYEDLAYDVLMNASLENTDDPELVNALRKLLESKDAAVRAVVALKELKS